jgi:PAS domain S-box-containing protein
MGNNKGRNVEIELWDDLKVKKASFFLSLFMPILVVFSIFNFIEQNLVVACAESVLAALALVTLLFRRSMPSFIVAQLSVAYISVLSFVFLFFPAVGSVAYIWVVGLPYFTSYLVGCRNTVIWSSIFAVVSLIVGVVFKQQGISLYWGWSSVPYVALAYLTMVIFASYFAFYFEKYFEELKSTRIKHLDGTLALKESEDKYLTLLNSSLNAVGVHRGGKWVYMNPACLELVGEESLEDVVGKPLLDYVHTSSKAMVLERTRIMHESKSGVPKVEQKYVRKDGTVIPVEVQSHPIDFDGEESYMITIRDLTHHKKQEDRRRELERQLEHGQRLESLGLLAGGIAHDFNNLLAGISGNAELLKDEVGHEEGVKDYLEGIDEGCEHAADLCQQMLAYAGKGKYTSEYIVIPDLVKSMGKLVKASVPSYVKIRIKIGKNLPLVEADVSQVKQVILNLIVNAADAIGKAGGEVKITIGLFRGGKTKGLVYCGNNLSEGEFVYVEVKDTGCGMPRSEIEKIFDPFYTTKEEGNGLGLAAVLGIVRSHEGAIIVESEKGKGTSFKVMFPASVETKASRMVDTGEVKDWVGHGTVLIVDDEERVLKVAKSFVAKLDFDVLTATNGWEGVNVFKEHHSNIKAVLIDMTMPVLGGIDAMLEMREINPNVPIIIVSGYSEIETGDLAEQDQPDGFVRKPFKSKDLKKELFRLVGVESKD